MVTSAAVSIREGSQRLKVYGARSGRMRHPGSSRWGSGLPHRPFQRTVKKTELRRPGDHHPPRRPVGQASGLSLKSEMSPKCTALRKISIAQHPGWPKFRVATPHRYDLSAGERVQERPLEINQHCSFCDRPEACPTVGQASGLSTKNAPLLKDRRSAKPPCSSGAIRWREHRRR
jgi:hypothetical protein